MTYDLASRAATAIAELTGHARHHIGLVLGSGLSTYASRLPDSVSVPYDQIPGFPEPSVSGHGGTLVSARIGPARGLVLAGRAHYYEGHDLEDVVLAVRAASLAGCRAMVLTNAAGGINPRFAPGDLALITDHLNLTSQNPLLGSNDDRLGTRFPDMTEVYSPLFRSLAVEVAGEIGLELQEGVYAWLTGPSYETPAEIRMLDRLGADLVGMSTVPEAIALRHMGTDVLGISLVTNKAAGLSGTPLSHDEVEETAAQAAVRFEQLLGRLLPAMAAVVADSG